MYTIRYVSQQSLHYLTSNSEHQRKTALWYCCNFTHSTHEKSLKTHRHNWHEKTNSVQTGALKTDCAAVLTVKVTSRGQLQLTVSHDEWQSPAPDHLQTAALVLARYHGAAAVAGWTAVVHVTSTATASFDGYLPPPRQQGCIKTNTFNFKSALRL